MFESLANTHYEKTELPFEVKDLPFKKLKDLVGQEVRIWGYYKTKTKFGTQVNIINDRCVINMPMWFTNHLDEKFSTDERNALWSSNCYLTNIQEKDTGKGNKTVTFSIEQRTPEEIPFK